MASQSIGVEIHPLGVRTARVSVTSRGIQVHQVAEAAFEEGIPFTALQADGLPEEAASVLDARLFRGRTVVAVVDHPSAVLSTFDLAEGFTDELSTSIKWYAEQYVPYPVDQATVDFRVQASPYGGQATVQLIAMENAVLKTVMDLLSPKRVRVRRIDGVPHALSRLYERLTAAAEAVPEPAVLIHASGAGAYLVVVRDGVVETMRHARLGDSWALALADKVRQTCQHYEVHHPSQSVQAAYATPATVAVDGMPAENSVRTTLSDELGIEVKALDLTPHVTFAAGCEAAAGPDGAPDGAPRKWAERFTLAIGAAC